MKLEARCQDIELILADVDGVLAFTRTRAGTDDCHDALLDHFDGER